MTCVPIKLRLRGFIFLVIALFPAHILTQVNYNLSDFSPEDLTMGGTDQQLEIVMIVSSTSDSLDLVRIVASSSDTLSSNPGDYSATGGNPSSWTIAISTSRDTVTYTPNTIILPGDVITFRLTVAGVASDSADIIQNWDFEARDHDENLWGTQTPQTTDRALEIINIRFEPAGANDGSASANQTLDSVLVEVTNHATDSITLEALDTRIFGDAYSSTGTEGSMPPTLSAGALDTASVNYTDATVTSSLGYKTASATVGNVSVPVTRTRSELLLVQEPGSLSILSVSTQPLTVSREQDSISVHMMVENAGEASVAIDSSKLRFVKNGVNRDSDYDVNIVSGVDTIHGGQVSTFDLRVDVHSDADTGIVELNGRVWGRDINSGAQTSDTTATTPDSFQVQTKTELEVQRILAAQDTVSREQENISVLMIIENTGQADASVDSASLRFLSNGGNVDNDYSVILLTQLSTLPGGNTDTLDYLVDVDSLATLDSIIIHGRIFGRDSNSNQNTLDTTAAQPDTWIVQNGAELVCSLWAEPDTVIISQDIYLYMRVSNPGGAYADSVVPHISLLGDGSVSLGSGPTPPWRDIRWDSAMVFEWIWVSEDTPSVWFEGHSMGKDRNTDSTVISDTVTSNSITIQTPPDLVFINNTLKPDTFTQNQTVHCTLMVRNVGQAWVRLLRSTILRFSDTDEDTASAHLISEITVEGLSDSALLTFDPMLIPPSMEVGDWQAKLDLIGEARNEYSYVQLSLPIDWVTVQDSAELQETSLSPECVTQGQDSVQIIAVLMNSGGVDIALNTNSSISFTDGIVAYEAYLVAPTTVPVHGETELRFMAEKIPEEMTPGSYQLHFDLHGTDPNGKLYHISFQSDPTNSIQVQTPPHIAYDSSSLDPIQVTQGQEVGFHIGLRNNGQAGVILPKDETTLRFQDIGGHQFIAYLHDTVDISGETDKRDIPDGDKIGKGLLSSSFKEMATLHFSLSRVDSQFIAGIYRPEVEIIGIDYNGKPYQHVLFTDSLTVLAPARLLVSLDLPSSVNLNQLFQVVMGVTNTGGAGALGVFPSPDRLDLQGTADVTYQSGPNPPFFDLSPGSTKTFTWEYRAGTVTGWVNFSGAVLGQDEISSDTVRSGISTSSDLSIQLPTALSASFLDLPADHYIGYEFQIELEVHNIGEALADSVYPEPLTSSNPEFIELRDGPDPEYFQLQGGDINTFSWRYRIISGEGQWIRFTGRASGRDANTGNTVQSGLVHSDSIYIHSATAKEIRVVPENRAPISCAMGQRNVPMLDFDLTNMGDTMVHTAAVTSITIRIEDEESRGIIPGSAISSLSIHDYSRDEIIATASAPDSGYHVWLIIPDDIYLRAGEPRKLGILTDVAANAGVRSFRVNLADTNSIIAVDSVWAEVDSLVRVGIRDGIGEPLSNMRSDYTVILPPDLENSFCNYPNPFAAGEEVTHITYNLLNDSRVVIKIYTLVGEPVWVAEFAIGSPQAEGGFHEVDWDGRNEAGEVVRNGVYLCKIETNNGTAITKIAVVK